MPRSSTTFQKGQSGNRWGRPPGLVQTLRGAIRAELSKPDPGSPTETRYESWARQIVEEAELGGNGAKMEVLKFLEGASPADKGEPPADLDDSELTDDNGNSIDP
jgi:Family of unknown function (DUF5681)